MKIIKKLTPKQQAAIPVFVKKYIKLASKKTNREKATQAVCNLYTSIGEEKPIVIFAKSPLSSVIMATLTKAIARTQLNTQLSSQLSGQINSHLHSQLINQLDTYLSTQLIKQLDRKLRTQLSSQLDRQLSGQLSSHLDIQLISPLYRQLLNQLGLQLRTQLIRQLDIQLIRQLRGQINSHLHSQLSNQLDRQLYKSTKKLEYVPYWVTAWYLTWAGWFDFGKYIGAKLNTKKSKLFMDFVKNISFIIPYKGIAFVSETPKKIIWEDKKLHSTTGPAVQYADGYSLYSLYGIRLEKENFDKVTNKKATFNDIMGLKNIELRMAALKLKGAEFVLKESKAECIDKQTIEKTIAAISEDGQPRKIKAEQTYELYKIDNKDIFSTPQYCCKYICPSTDRVYVSFIDPEVGRQGDVILAMASRWKKPDQKPLTKQEFINFYAEA